MCKWINEFLLLFVCLFFCLFVFVLLCFVFLQMLSSLIKTLCFETDPMHPLYTQVSFCSIVITDQSPKDPLFIKSG